MFETRAIEGEAAGRERCRTLARAGFSLVELLIALTVLVIGVGAVTTSLVSANSLNQTKRERSLAADAASSALESLKGSTFAQVFARYDADGADDPGGANTAPGANFAVDGLSPQDDDEDGFVGEIVFPGGPEKLLEDVEDEDLGMPRDLNGDGDVDGNDHSDDYQILPVKVRLRWKGQHGDQELEFVTVLTDL